MIKKAAILLMCIIVISILPGFVPANGRDYYDENVLDYIMFDYIALTGNSESVSEQYFLDLLETGSSGWTRGVDGLFFGNDSLETEIIYIQNNYNEIVLKLDEKGKESLDKYILDISLQYYHGKDLPDSTSYVRNEDDCNATPYASTIATLRISSDISDEHTWGSSGLEVELGKHAWLVITNTSTSSIQVGMLMVSPGTSITVGTYGWTHGHRGVWYNYDGYFAYQGAYTNNKSYVMNITQSQLNRINEEILEPDNDTWSYTYNCSSFAVEVWNSVASTTFSAGIINNPRTLYNNIAQLSGHRSNMAVPYDGAVYYDAENPTLWTP